MFRRLVARTIAQQLGPAIERATSPFQYALSTRAGTECIAHAIQALTDLDPSATVLSIDGIGAFDLVSARLVACGWRRFSVALRHAILRGSFVLFMGRSGRRRAHHHSG